MAFYNVSNHPSARWSASQLEAAQKMGGKVVDIAFPNVPSTSTTEQVEAMAEELAADLWESAGGSPSKSPEEEIFAMIQGEMTLTAALVRALQNLGVICLAACSDRRTVETQNADGSTVKTAIFEFVQFRPYSNVR